MTEITITKREILVCIAITLLLIGIGCFISGAIRNSINESNEIYFKALKINDDENMFKHVLKTNIGHALVHGTVQAVKGVSIEDIEGIYFKIRKVKEVYTKHTRQVEHTRTKSDGTTETYYTTEEYWTWDYNGEEEWHVDKFKFLNEEFDFGTISFYNEDYLETKKGEYHVRYKYYTIPFEFKGTLFTNIINNTINNNYFYFDANIEDIIKVKENEVASESITFWTIWILFIGLIDFGYVYLDNNYLED